jgi:hypothetical protein
MSTCKHCNRCKDGCDFCSCCGKCQRCDAQGPFVAPPPVYVPYPVYPDPVYPSPWAPHPDLGPTITWRITAEAPPFAGNVGGCAVSQVGSVWAGETVASFASH